MSRSFRNKIFKENQKEILESLRNKAKELYRKEPFVTYDYKFVCINGIEYKEYIRVIPKELINISLQKVEYQEIKAELYHSMGKFGSVCPKILLNNFAINVFLNDSPSAAAIKVNSAFYKAFVEWLPPEIVSKFLIRNKRLSTRHIRALHKEDCLEKVMEAYSDNLLNLIPFIIHQNKTPKELKEIYGNKNWKLICKNTISRNNLLADYLGSEQFRYIDYEKDFIDEVLLLPSSLLKDSSMPVDFRVYAANNLKGIWQNLNELTKHYETFRDLRRLIERLSEKDFKYRELRTKCLTWSPRRIKEEHDNLAKEYTKLSTNDTKYGWLNFTDSLDLTSKDYTAVVLKSEREIAEEGAAMYHCVAAYSHYVKRGEYIVISIRNKNGERLSTLGLELRKPVTIFSAASGPLSLGREQFWNIQQCYGRANSRVDQGQLAFASDIAEDITIKYREWWQK